MTRNSIRNQYIEFLVITDPPPMKSYICPSPPKSSANRDIGGAFHPASHELQVDVRNAGIGRDAAAKSAPTSLSIVPTACVFAHKQPPWTTTVAMVSADSIHAAGGHPPPIAPPRIGRDGPPLGGGGGAHRRSSGPSSLEDDGRRASSRVVETSNAASASGDGQIDIVNVNIN